MLSVKFFQGEESEPVSENNIFQLCAKLLISTKGTLDTNSNTICIATSRVCDV